MESLKTEGLGERSISDINVNEYSASFVRNLVKNGKKKDFTQVYKDYLADNIINQLYDAIKMGVETQALKAPKRKVNNEKDEINNETVSRKKTRLGGGNKTRKVRRTKMSKRRQQMSKGRKIKKSKKQRRTRRHRKSKRYT